MNKSRILESSPKRFIGMDLHTDKFNTCETKEDSSEKIERKFNINENDLESFVSALDKNTYVLLESCANAFKIAEFIKPHVAEVIVGDTHKLKNISLTNKKTDKVDAEKLSMSFLTQSIIHFKNASPELNKWYEFKTKNTKKGKIRMGACRKIIVNIYHILSREQSHYFRDEKNHTSKMRQYDIFLKKTGLFYEESKIA